MATGFKFFFARAEQEAFVSLSEEEREKMKRNAAKAAERLKAHGNVETEVQDIRRRARLRQKLPA